MNILVTGGAGYVGSVLVQMLLQAGHKVRVLDSLRKGGLCLLALFADRNLEFVRGDIRDEETVKKALQDMDVIIHLAAIVGFPACQKDPWLARQINVDGTLNIDRLRHKDQTILFPSSLSNYGTVVGEVCTEEMTPKPITLYGETKIQAEQHLLASGNVIIFRPATAFGLSSQMRLDLLLNYFVFTALKERFLVVYEPHFNRAFIHVRDFARAFLFALENGSKMKDQIYNLGDESLNLTKGELAERIRKKIDFVLEFSDKGEDPDKRNYIVDFSKLHKAGFKAKISIDEGIEELARGLQVIDIKNPFSNTTFL